MHRFAALLLPCSALGFCLFAASLVQPAQSLPAYFTLCAIERSAHCVVDGDTIRWDGDVVRLEDIDAPEIHDYGCAAEQALGQRATSRLRDLINSGTVTLRQTGSRDTDVYGRKLRVLALNDMSLGGILVTEGLARRWTGSRRPWCA